MIVTIIKKIKKTLIILIFIWMPFLSYAEKNSTLELEAYFSAIIVSDFDTSINWYSNTLGFEVINRVESAERGFKQSNLKRGDVLIELIQLNKAFKLADTVPKYNNKMRIVGFFKLGFLVKNFDKWLDHLTSEKVAFYGRVVTDEITGKRMVIITDPDSNRIQIFEK